MSDSWQPKTKIGMMVKEGKIASIEELFMNNYRITEPEIVDYLVPNLQQEVLNIKLVQRQTDAGEKSRFKAVDRIKLTVEITPQLRERLYAYTAKTGVKLRFLVERALEEYLAKMGA
jgi:hypothetical protein